MTTPRWVAGILLVSGALFVIVSFGCSSSDPAGPGGGGGGGGGTLSNTLTGVQTQYFGGANEATFNSLAFFGPLVGNLGVRTWKRQDGFMPDAASAVSCLVDSLVGKVFDYSGGHYVSTGLTGAPPEGARFLLYEINSEGQVNMANQIGYLDVICTAGGLPGQISQSVQVVIGGTTVLSLSLSGYHPVGTSILYSGSLLSADGATTLFPGGQVADSIPGDSIVNAHHVSLGFDEITPGLSAGFHEYENLGTGQKEYLILVNSFGATFFEVWVNLQVNSQDVITSGTARFTEGYETRTVACISGSLDSPVVTSNSGACTVEGTVPGAYSLGNLDDIKLTFQAFRAMHTAMKGLVEGVLSLVAVPTT